MPLASLSFGTKIPPQITTKNPHKSPQKTHTNHHKTPPFSLVGAFASKLAFRLRYIGDYAPCLALLWHKNPSTNHHINHHKNPQFNLVGAFLSTSIESEFLTYYIYSPLRSTQTIADRRKPSRARKVASPWWLFISQISTFVDSGVGGRRVGERSRYRWRAHYHWRKS